MLLYFTELRNMDEVQTESAVHLIRNGAQLLSEAACESNPFCIPAASERSFAAKLLCSCGLVQKAQAPHKRVPRRELQRLLLRHGCGTQAPTRDARTSSAKASCGLASSVLSQRPTSRPQLNDPGPEPLYPSVLRSKLRHLGLTVGLPSVESGSSTPPATPPLRSPAARSYKDQARSHCKK